MSSLFSTLLNMSLTASYVVLAVIIVRMFLKKAPKIFSYALWAVVFFRLLCPFTFESPLSVLPVNTEAIPFDIIYSQNPAITTGIGIADNAMNQSIQSTLPAVNPVASVNPIGIVLEIGAIIWMLGIMVLLSYGVISYFRLKLRLSTATLVYDNIYATDRIKTPFVLGFIKPKIYIPIDLSGSELSYIIKHEETHIRHYDYIIKPVAFLALTIHWFNPLIWFSYFLMVKDMEMSCDECVMKQSNEDIRVNYSNSLLALSAKQSGLLSPLSFGESNVKSRIKNVLNYKKPQFWVIITAIIAVTAAAVGLGANPVGSITYKNDHYGFSVVLPKDFAENVDINEEENFIFFTYKEIQDMYPDGITGVVGRIEIYDKKEMTKNQLKELSDMYNLRYLGENEKYYFGWAHATDVQIPPDASAKIKDNYRALEEEFDQVIKTFKIENKFNNEIMSVVEDFGSRLQMVSLAAPEEIVARSIKENYSDLVSPALIEKWTNDPQNAPGRVLSSPWPERINILSIKKLSADVYEVKGTIIEITSVESASGGIVASRPITLKVKNMDKKWLIDALTMGEYQDSSGSTAGRVNGKKHICYDTPDAVYAMYKKALLESDCEIIIALTPSAKPQPYDQEIWDTVKISEVKLLKKDIRKNKACYSLELNIADGGKSAFETGIFPRWLWMSKNEKGWSVEGLMTGGEPPEDWWN